jgi:hypothetical protein
MKKNPTKDASILNGQTQSHQPLSAEEQKLFEAEVQERIRQAKQQLKANSPFANEEIEDTPSTPILETKPVATLTVDNSSKEMLDKANQRIAELESQLKFSNQTQKPQERKPIYGMAAAESKSQLITKDDLKLEFLNFTSAHIDQFNNRIKKTEEIVSSLLQQQPNEFKTQKSFPKWLPWLNVALLSVSTLLLLGLFFSDKTSNSTMAYTASTVLEASEVPKSNTPQEVKPKPVESTPAKQPINSPISPSPKTSIPTPTVATQNNAIAAKPIPTEEKNMALAKKETPAPSQPVAATKTPITTIVPKPEVAKQTPPVKVKQNFTNLKLVKGSASLGQTKPKLPIQKTIPQNNIEQTPQVAVSAPPPAKVEIPTSPKPTQTAKSYVESNNNNDKNNNLKEAIQPVIDIDKKVVRKQTRNQPKEIEPKKTRKQDLNRNNQPIVEVKTATKPSTPKKKTKTEDVSFGED